MDSQVEAITVASGRIYVGGKFHRVNSTSGYARLAALEPATGRIVAAFKPKSRGHRECDRGPRRPDLHRARRAGRHGHRVYDVRSPALDGDLRRGRAGGGGLGDTVYVGGHFDKACRTARTGIQGVCLDGDDRRVKLAALATTTGNLRPWTADANGVEGVLTMAAGAGSIAVGGAFTTINGGLVKRLAQFS